MSPQIMLALECSLDHVFDDLARMRYILAEHYFNWKLSSITNLRDFVLNLLTTMKSAQGPQHQHQHHDSPSQMCTTKGVIEAIEKDIQAILNTASIMDHEYITKYDVANQLRERMAAVLDAMGDEVRVKVESAEFADYGSEDEVLYQDAPISPHKAAAAPEARRPVPNRQKMIRRGNWSQYLAADLLVPGEGSSSG